MYDHETFNLLPYSDGIAWIQYGDRDDPVTSAVDTSGNILFTLNGSIRYMSPFSDGYAYYAASDDEGVYEVIVDKHGNICWIADRANNEHIIAGGDREFVVERHTTGFDSDYMEIGTVDPYGNTIQAYAHEINGTAYNESMHLDSTFCHPLDVYSKVEGSGHRSLSRYMGDHLYCLSGKILYNPQLGVLYYRDSLDIWPEETSNGRFRTLQTDYGNPELPRASLFDAGMNMLASQPYYYYERTGQGAYGLEWPEHDYTDDVYYRDGLYYANHCYWDDANNIALHIAGYPDRDMQGGPFYDGKAVLWIEGADGPKYVTVIDTAGNILFDPVQAHSSFFTIWNGYFLVEETQWNWCIYDTAGNRIRSVTDDIMPYNEYGAVEYSDISEGFMTVTYHDKKLKMLYSIHNAVNDHV